MTKDNKYAFKCLLIFMVAIIASFFYSDYSKQQKVERRAAKKAACQANPVCRDANANHQAQLQSLRNSSVVRSSTGVVYFNGNICTRDCSGHIAGYRWAEERGISKDEGCTSYSQSFIDGCLIYVSERVAELEKNDHADHYDDSDSCTSGRYGDC